MPDTYMKKFYFPSLAAALAFVGFASSQSALADAIEASTADSPKWFRVYTPNRSNLTFTSNGVGNKFNGTSDATKPYGKNMLWRFEANDDGTYTIINMDGTYVSPDQFEAYGSNNAFVGVSEKPEKGWTVTAISGKTDLYTIANGTTQLHQGEAGSNYYIINYGGGSNVSDVGCQFTFEAIDASTLTTAATLKSVDVNPGEQTLAPGNKDQVLLQLTTHVNGYVGDVKAKSIVIGITGKGATTGNFKNIKIYQSADKNFVSAKRNATLVGQTDKFTGKATDTIAFNSDFVLPSGEAYFYVTADLKDDASVGDTINASMKAFYFNEKKLSVSKDPTGQAYIYSSSSKPFQPYDGDSHYWRIPAMVVLHNQTGANASKNGRIVTMADMRFTHNGDLPNHIDVYERHSDDQGKTWSEMKLVAGSEADHAIATAGAHGFGDAALVETAKGKLIAIMASGAGYFASTPTSSIVPVIITSEDGGETWTSPQSLYDVLYNSTYSQGAVQGSFAGSGRGIVLKRQKDEKLNGRIMFAMSHRFTTGSIQEYIIYSDDEGQTWHMSPNSAYSGGDESKLVELADGTVMISVRQSGNRGFNTSTDGGITWGAQTTNSGISGNACNADVLYYSNHILVHSYINNASRQNLTVCVSLDNGKTWTSKRVICAPSSCYSTMDITSDNEIAILYEDAACSDGYVINFAKFPITWLVSGNLSQKALETSIKSANTIMEAGGYTYVSTGKAGQYPQAELDKLAALIPTADQMATMTDEECDARSEAINALIEEIRSTRLTVDGYANTSTFTISSYELVNGSNICIDHTAQAVAKADTDNPLWVIVPATNAQQVYIKASDSETYLHRTDNTLDVQTTPAPWVLEKDASADYYYLLPKHTRETYVVVNVGTGAFNFWSNTKGNDTWSTKFVLTRVGDIVDGISPVSVAKQQSETFYDLSGRKVSRPTKGIYVTNTGRKVMR